MPRQNRVTPWNEIIATPARGTLMGNRGCLHNELGQLKRAYQSKHWIICRLKFKNRQRTIMAPGKYTELFFLDEATALAAGHRPCAECFHPRFKEFTAAWRQANPQLITGPKLPVAKLDAVLHQERLAHKKKVTYPERLANLPNGTIVTLAEKPQPYLHLEQTLLPWHPAGYGQPLTYRTDQWVQVLTPRSVVQTLSVGYQVQLHPTASPTP